MDESKQNDCYCLERWKQRMKLIEQKNPIIIVIDNALYLTIMDV